MDRKTVALTLGCSEKTVSRYVASGRLPDVRKNGALDINEADVQRLKAQLETPVLTAREVETGRDISALVPVPKRREVNSSNALAVLGRNAGHAETRRDRPFVPTSDKLLLSLEEAAALTGLSAARLRAAIGEEKLVARKVGRAWKMRRGDVERFVDSIFGR